MKQPIVTAVIDHETLAKADRYCDKQRLSRSALITFALAYFLAGNGEEAGGVGRDMGSPPATNRGETE